MAGACATILKAAFDGNIQFNTLGDKRIAAASNGDGGISLVDYTGGDVNAITVNGEINKLASNIGQARTLPEFIGGLIMNGGYGLARLSLSASSATKITTTSARISQASP
jgi:hypothetical protein